MFHTNDSLYICIKSLKCLLGSFECIHENSSATLVHSRNNIYEGSLSIVARSHSQRLASELHIETGGWFQLKKNLILDTHRGQLEHYFHRGYTQNPTLHSVRRFLLYDKSLLKVCYMDLICKVLCQTLAPSCTQDGIFFIINLRKVLWVKPPYIESFTCFFAFLPSIIFCP